MNDITGLLPCSKCGVFPDLYNPMNSATIAGLTELTCPNCGKVITGHNYEEAAIAWNHYNKNNSKEKQNEEPGLKDILKLVDKVEDLLKNFKFEWLMYDSNEKAWTFRVKKKQE